MSEYFEHLLFLVLIYSILGMSLNLIAGYTGLLSLAHAAFFGLGAYITSLMTLRGWPWPSTLVLATLAGGAVAWVMGRAVLGFRGDDFVVVTFGFQVIAFRLAQNWSAVTRGPIGVAGIPEPEILGWRLSTHLRFIVAAGLLATLVGTALWRMVSSPFGRVLRAIRSDEVLAQSFGKRVHGSKNAAFVVGSAVASMVGSLYAPYLTYISPESFSADVSIFLIALVIVGGAGWLAGSIAGALVMVVTPELLRFVGMPEGAASYCRQLLYGFLLVACILWRPRGLFLPQSREGPG